MAKKTVFITGGTGNMGWAAVQEMLKHPSDINIKMLYQEWLRDRPCETTATCICKVLIPAAYRVMIAKCTRSLRVLFSF